jgi:hypothetical protein
MHLTTQDRAALADCRQADGVRPARVLRGTLLALRGSTAARLLVEGIKEDYSDPALYSRASGVGTLHLDLDYLYQLDVSRDGCVYAEEVGAALFVGGDAAGPDEHIPCEAWQDDPDPAENEDEEGDDDDDL